MHMINIFTQRRQAREDDGRARRARARPEQLQPPHRHRLAARRHVLRGRRLRRHARGEVRSRRQVPDGLGPAARRSRQPRARTSSGRCTASASAATAALFVADREHHRMQVFDENGKFLEMWPTGHNSAVLAHIVTAGRLRLGGRLDDRSAREVRPRRALHPRHRRARPAAGPVRRRPPDQRRLGTQPLRDRGRQRPLAEVPAEGRTPTRRRSSARWWAGARRRADEATARPPSAWP